MNLLYKFIVSVGILCIGTCIGFGIHAIVKSYRNKRRRYDIPTDADELMACAKAVCVESGIGYIHTGSPDLQSDNKLIIFPSESEYKNTLCEHDLSKAFIDSGKVHSIVGLNGFRILYSADDERGDDE